MSKNKTEPTEHAKSQDFVPTDPLLLEGSFKEMQLDVMMPNGDMWIYLIGMLRDGMEASHLLAFILPETPHKAMVFFPSWSGIHAYLGSFERLSTEKKGCKASAGLELKGGGL